GGDAGLYRRLLVSWRDGRDHGRFVFSAEEERAWQRRRGSGGISEVHTMIRIITIDREFGSGGPDIAKLLAERLGWKLWDQSLTSEIARLAQCDQSEVQCREERTDPLYYRLFKSFLRGSFEGSLNVYRLKLLAADSIFRLTQRIVLQAADEGNCVIVGRGSAFFLENRKDAFHVFLYAPYEEKLRRLAAAGTDRAEAAQLVETVDR